MPRQATAEHEKARRSIAARLIVICALIVCAGILLAQGVEYALSFRRESISILASAGESNRVLPDSDETRININTAAESDLKAVPGIGPELARRVIASREERGEFHFLEELKDVSGIGDKRFDMLKVYFFCPPPDIQQRDATNDPSF